MPETAPVRLERELADGADLARLVSLGPEVTGAMTAASLVGVIDSYRRWKEWRERAIQASKQLESVEREVVSRTTTPHQLAAIERGVKLCAAARVDPLDRPGVLSTVLELWDAARAEVRRNGKVRCNATRDDHPALEVYDDYVGRTFEIDGLRAYRWLAIRRAEREGVLALDLDLSAASLKEQAALRKGRLGKGGKDRDEASLLQELVLDDLDPAVRWELDLWAKGEALKSAANAYAGLLTVRPLRADRLVAAYLGTPSQNVGLALLDAEGGVADSLDLDPADADWMDRATAFIKDCNVKNLVVPTDTRSSKRLAELESRIGGGYAIVPVRPAALSDGRHALPGKDRELPKSAQNAVVLGRRALKPIEAWGEIDPVRAGVGEYQSELDEKELRQVLEAARDQAKRQVARAPIPSQAVAPTRRALTTLVRTAAELRPGMTIEGTVTNLTGFGAFIALGLEYEGMIHVSELADQFVSDPSEVVKIGQKVTARVLEVDPNRRRISLSLRSGTDLRERRSERSGGGGGGPRRSGGGGGRGGGGGGGGGSRSQVLRDLNNLFKKLS